MPFNLQLRSMIYELSCGPICCLTKAQSQDQCANILLEILAIVALSASRTDPSSSPSSTCMHNLYIQYPQTTLSHALTMSTSYFFIILLLPFLFSPNHRFADGGKRRIHISDDLDDVIDDEEDEAWKQWGKKSTPSSDEFDPPPSDLSNLDMSQIQELMMKQHLGPVFGFVKLRFGVRRTPDMVVEIATKWTKVLRTGQIEVNFMGVDTSTIMFTMEKGQNTIELKEFILNQPEAYEIKIGDQVFRRPGDPPLEEVIEKLQSKKDKTSDTTEHLKEEL